MKKLFFTFLFAAAAVCTQAQNVGIGNTNPTEKLDVTGNIKADTVKPTALKLTPNAGTGKILTSDAAGNASWAQSSTVAGNVGYGLWGDCATNGSISEYLPVADSAGLLSDELGNSVSISGEFAFIGIPYANIGANANQGAVIVYKYENNGWNYFTKLTDATGAGGDAFGYSVCINGNYAIIGSYNDDVGANSNQGSATIFQYNGTSWVQMQKVTDPTGAANDLFGSSVSISGNKAIIGSPRDDFGGQTDKGAAIAYQFNGTNWVFLQLLQDLAISSNDQFGFAVSMSGDNLIVGAPYDEAGGSGSSGSIIMYRFNGTSWVEIQQIINSPTGTQERFGYSVSIHNNYAVVGRPGKSVAEGDALVYFYNGTSWSLLSTLARPAVAAGDNFGNSVSISGNYILVGAYVDDIGSSIAEGGVALFTKVGNFWQQLQYITDPAGSANNYMGNSVAIDGTTKRFLIGAPGAFSNRGKVIFGKVN